MVRSLVGLLLFPLVVQILCTIRLGGLLAKKDSKLAGDAVLDDDDAWAVSLKHEERRRATSSELEQTITHERTKT